MLLFCLVFHINKLNRNWIFVTYSLEILKKKGKRGKFKFNL